VAKVSIQIPVFNGEKYLRQTLASVLDNSPDDVEVFVTDNGSSDNSIDIISDFARQDSRIRFECYTQGRCSRAYMIEHTDADYIILFDHDDIFPPGRITRQMEFLENNPGYSATYGNTYVYNKGKVHFYTGRPFSNFTIFTLSNPTGCGAVMARKKNLLEAGNFISLLDPATGKIKGSGDFFMWQRLGAVAPMYYDMDCVAYIYRLHPGQVIRTMKHNNSSLTSQAMITHFSKNNDKLLNAITSGTPLKLNNNNKGIVVQALAVLYFFCQKLQSLRKMFLDMAEKLDPEDYGVRLERIALCISQCDYNKAEELIDEMLHENKYPFLTKALLSQKISIMEHSGRPEQEINTYRLKLTHAEQFLLEYTEVRLNSDGILESIMKYL
jgi:glycosyltransferase involved in cell wall biosynthesis